MTDQPLLDPSPDVDNKYDIPVWESLQKQYDAKWNEEKEKFHNQLKENFRALTSQYKSGRQEIYELSDSPYTSSYERAFRELFSDTGYQATVGEMERLGSTGNKKVRKLYVTLPNAFSS